MPTICWLEQFWPSQTIKKLTIILRTIEKIFLKLNAIIVLLRECVWLFCSPLSISAPLFTEPTFCWSMITPNSASYNIWRTLMNDLSCGLSIYSTTISPLSIVLGLYAIMRMVCHAYLILPTLPLRRIAFMTLLATLTSGTSRPPLSNIVFVSCLPAAD